MIKLDKNDIRDFVHLVNTCAAREQMAKAVDWFAICQLLAKFSIPGTDEIVDEIELTMIEVFVLFQLVLFDMKETRKEEQINDAPLVSKSAI